MKDPYVTLGVSPSASDDEVKKAYRDLARKYHPDNYQGNELADLAQEKMKEINEAYDEITRMRQGGGGSSGGGRQRASWGGAGGGSGAYAAVRQAINTGNIAHAEQLLQQMSSRDAEWHFLMGSVCYRKGWFDEARRYVETACRMEPTNAEYAQAFNMMRGGGHVYRAPGGFGGTGRGGMSGCDCCSSLICADCCCECFGGDIIPCC